MDNPVIKAILERRSIRSFRPEPVTDTQVDQLEAAALAAPSAVNFQPYHFSFVRDAELLDQISGAAVAQMGRDPYLQIFYRAPLVVLLFADPDKKWSVLDSGIAVQNLALSAHALGLGSVIVGMAESAFAGEAAQPLRQRLGVPDGYRFAISIAIGVPAVSKPGHEIHPGRVTRVDSCGSPCADK